MTAVETPCIEGQVLAAATRLFAALGHDAVSLQMIADAVGCDVSRVIDRFGTRTELYQRVMHTVAEQERHFLQAAIATLPPGVDGIVRLAEMYLDYCLEHPELVALWMHRWLADAADMAELEARYAAPVLTLATDAVRSGAPHADADLVVWSVIWTVHGYLRAGLHSPDGRRRSPHDPTALARVRAHLRHTLRSTLMLPLARGAVG